MSIPSSQENQATPEHPSEKTSGALSAEKQNEPFVVVGLGASAGGIQALQSFFEGMPAQNGMAFVVVVHLSPDYESNLVQVLQARTGMAVVQVTEPVHLEVDHVYVIPPNHHLVMQDSRLHLTEPQQTQGKRVAIDLFFRTLAEAYGQRAVCIVLSGTDSDGAIGLKHIRAQGGVTVVQDPEEAEYDGMPRSALATGIVDWMLPVTKMPARLLEHINNEKRLRLPPEAGPSLSLVREGEPRDEEALPASMGEPAVGTSKGATENDEQALHEVLLFLRAQTGHDFSHYKRATILRRVARRLQVNSLETIPLYLDFMRSHASEAHALLQDLLIGVTHFFRDHDAFAALEAHIPQLFAGKTIEDQVRVWVAGCATGEEAYSLAMLLHEHAAKLPAPPTIQVFATDLDEEAIHSAREALYPLAIEADVSQERLRRFFYRDVGRYRISKEVRETVLFAAHDLLKDSPFSRLDLISCRNLLIYLKRNAQERVFDIFHFALRPSGLLFLGNSESVDDVHSLFGTLDKRYRLYVRRATSRPAWLHPPIPVPGATRRRNPPPVLPSVSSSATLGTTGPATEMLVSSPEVVEVALRLSPRPMLFGELHLKLLEQYAPPSVVVNANHDIVHLSEHAGQFLQFMGGEPSMNLLKIVHPDLRLELHMLLLRAPQSNENLSVKGVAMQSGDTSRRIDMHVRPVQFDTLGPNFFLVLFDTSESANHTAVEALTSETVAAFPPPDKIARQLEAEIYGLKNQLGLIVEQYETSVEELKASNEELQAMNEELRSASEELETSKEELRAVNEELTTVNQEMKSSNEELLRANSDLQNLMASTEIGTIFLDRQLRIKRFTPRIQEIFNVIPTDIGRPLSDITRKLSYDALSHDARHVLDSLVRIEREVSSDGRWFLVRILPYYSLDHRIDGVILTFVDIAPLKQAQEDYRASEARFSAMINQATAGMMLCDLTGKITFVNHRYCEILGYSESELIGLTMFHLTFPEDLPHETRDFERLVAQGIPYELEKRFLRRDRSIVWVHANVSVLRNAEGQVNAALAIVIDLSQRKQVEKQLLQAHTDLESEAHARIEEFTQATGDRRQLMRQLVIAQEEERRRLSRELHDQLGQSLAGVRMKLQNLRGEAGDTPHGNATEGAIQELEALTNGLMTQIHVLAWQLRPAELDELGLQAALEQFVSKWQQSTGTTAEFVVSGSASDDGLSVEIGSAFYRVAQEALSNVARHANASNVSVILEHASTSLTLVIEDDGQGVDLEIIEGNKHKRLGIIGMRERLEMMNGTLTVESTRGQGTTVYARVPLDAND